MPDVAMRPLGLLGESEDDMARVMVWNVGVERDGEAM